MSRSKLAGERGVIFRTEVVTSSRFRVRAELCLYEEPSGVARLAHIAPPASMREALQARYAETGVPNYQSQSASAALRRDAVGAGAPVRSHSSRVCLARLPSAAGQQGCWRVPRGRFSDQIKPT